MRLRRALAGVAPGTTLSLLDLGTGAGDLPARGPRVGAERGDLLVPLALERSRVAAGLARSAGVPCAVACAGAPPSATSRWTSSS